MTSVLLLPPILQAAGSTGSCGRRQMSKSGQCYFWPVYTLHAELACEMRGFILSNMKLRMLLTESIHCRRMQT